MPNLSADRVDGVAGSVPWGMRFQRLRHPIFSYRRARVLPRWLRRIDSRVGRAVNGRDAHRGIDDALRRLSRTADRGRLWFSIAGLLLLRGDGRAAARGVASLTAASIVANLIGKQLFGGPRPLLKDVPLTRRLAKYPTSASFPSGHSASAAAFATGVALENGRAGAGIAPLAAAVIYSRLHVGAHWFSDIVAGTALGAGVALLGRVLIPAKVPQHQPMPGTGAAIALPALGDGEGVIIVMNASAGNDTVHADPKPIIERALPRAELRLLEKDERFEDVVEAALASDTPPRVLGVCGGDGSVSRMAHLARRHSLPLLALPGGTFNHFARSAGLDELSVGIAALRAGTGLLVAAGELDLPDGQTKTVLNAAAVGIYPDFVAERKKRKPRLGKWLGGIAAAWHIARTADPVEIEVDGTPLRVWSLFVSVGRNDPAQIATMQRRSLDDDELDVRILHASVSRLRAVASLAFGRRTARVLRFLHVLPPTSAVDSFTAPSLEVVVTPRHGQAPGFTHDGELEDLAAEGIATYRSTVRISPRSLRVYAPHTPGTVVDELPRAEQRDAAGAAGADEDDRSAAPA